MKAEETIYANTQNTLRGILEERGEAFEGSAPLGSLWIFDACSPYDSHHWRLFLHPQALDPARTLVPSAVDRIRLESHSLINAFPATPAHLERVGCAHVDLLYRPIVQMADATAWAYSIFNYGVPTKESQ